MRRRKGIYRNVILIVLLLFLALEILLPRYAVNELRGMLTSRTESIANLEVEVSAFPSLKILFGKINLMKIKAQGVMVDRLYLDSLVVEYRDIILKDGTFSGNNTHLDILVKEESLNNYINDKYSELQSFQLDLLADQLIMAGDINFLEANFTLQLAGGLFINENKTIVFIPENFQVEELNIPVSLIRKYVKDFGFSFDLRELQIPLRIEEIKIEKGEISIRGDEFS